MVKNLPAVKGMWIPSQGWEDPLGVYIAFLPGESHGQSRLMGYRPWDCKELDTTEQAHITSEMLFDRIYTFIINR